MLVCRYWWFLVKQVKLTQSYFFNLKSITLVCSNCFSLHYLFFVLAYRSQTIKDLSEKGNELGSLSREE